MTPLITRSADHFYTYAGKTYPGVTSILKVIDKSDALMSWAARNTAEAALRLSREQSPAGSEMYSTLDTLRATVGDEGAIKALTSRSTWRRDEAAQLGTEVHRLADLVIRDQPHVIPENAKKHVAHYADWWQKSGWTLRASEAMLVYPEHGYGGTLDILAYDGDGRTVIADIKTGKGVYKEAVLQLTAYGGASLVQIMDTVFTGTVYENPKPDRYVILHVTADGVREIEVAVGALEAVAWAACIDLFTWLQTMKGKRL